MCVLSVGIFMLTAEYLKHRKDTKEKVIFSAGPVLCIFLSVMLASCSIFKCVFDFHPDERSVQTRFFTTALRLNNIYIPDYHDYLPESSQLSNVRRRQRNNAERIHLAEESSEPPIPSVGQSRSKYE